MSDRNENEDYEDNDEAYDYGFDMYFSDDALLEFNVNNWGVNIAGNAQGYLALARFCTYMAQVYMDIIQDNEGSMIENVIDGYGEYHIGDYINPKAIKDGHFIFSKGPIKKYKPEGEDQDIYFHLANQIGPKYWKGIAESGSDQEWIDRFAPPEENSDPRE